MEVPQFWVSDSNTVDNSTTTSIPIHCNVAPFGFYQRRLLLDEDMIPPHGDDAQVGDASVLQNQDDLEQPDGKRAPEPNGDPTQQLQSREPAQQLNRQPSQELQSPSTSETIPEFPTVDQSEETNESGEEDGSEEEDQPAEWGGKRSDDHMEESTGGLPLLPKLPSGKKIGVGYHKKRKQWEAHLWIKGHQLQGCKKKGLQIFLGNFQTEKEAKQAHDRVAIKLKMPPSARGKPYPLNFPAAVHTSYMEEHAQWTARDFVWKIRRTSNKFSKSKLKGVTPRKRSVKRGQELVTKYESKLSLAAKESGDDKKRTFSLGHLSRKRRAKRMTERSCSCISICRKWSSCGASRITDPAPTPPPTSRPRQASCQGYTDDCSQSLVA